MQQMLEKSKNEDIQVFKIQTLDVVAVLAFVLMLLGVGFALLSLGIQHLFVVDVAGPFLWRNYKFVLLFALGVFLWSYSIEPRLSEQLTGPKTPQNRLALPVILSIGMLIVPLSVFGIEVVLPGPESRLNTVLVAKHSTGNPSRQSSWEFFMRFKAVNQEFRVCKKPYQVIAEGDDVTLVFKRGLFGSQILRLIVYKGYRANFVDFMAGC